MRRATAIRRCALGLAVGLSVGAACGTGSVPGGGQGLLDQAATALGGRDRLRQVKSIVLDGGGTAGNLGQDLTPEATGQAFTITEYHRVLSFTANAMRIEQTRTPAFPYFQGPAAQRQILGVDGDVGYNISPLGVSVRVSEAATRQRRVDMFHHPIAAVRAALEPGATVSAGRREGETTLVDVTTATGVAFTLAIDNTTHLPSRVLSPLDDTNLGDVVLETTFSEYRDVSGMKVPARIVGRTDRWTTLDLRVETSVDGVTGDMAAPEDAVRSRPAAAVSEPVVDEQELAPGVWVLSGQSHHSVLIELADQLLLVEAPQHDARTLAVIRRARELRPSKPLTRVVNTHHHFDHSGGIRAAVAEGLTVVTHAGNASFFEEMIKRPHTVHPDALARAPRSLRVEPVNDFHEITDATRPVHLIHVAGSPHSSTMLMVYLPREKLLIEADVFTPSAPAPFAANLLETIERRNLAVDRIVPLHGVVVPFEALRTAVTQSAVPAR